MWMYALSSCLKSYDFKHTFFHLVHVEYHCLFSAFTVCVREKIGNESFRVQKVIERYHSYSRRVNCMAGVQWKEERNVKRHISSIALPKMYRNEEIKREKDTRGRSKM